MTNRSSFLKDSWPTEWEKIFASHIFNKLLVYRIHTKFIKLNNKNNKTTQLINGQRT